MSDAPPVETLELAPAVPGASPFVLALREELRRGAMPCLGDFRLGDLRVEVCVGADSIWAMVRRPNGAGLALRAAYAPAGGFDAQVVEPAEDEVFRIEAESVIGRYAIAFHTSEADLHRLRMRVEVRPRTPLLIPFLPRDLYPLNAEGDPLATEGHVEAAQRGVNGGLLYFRMDEPAFGSVLYLQNLTALNPYYRATETVPDAAVGGEWPELGYLPPTPPQSGTPPTRPLPAGEPVMLSDAILVFRDWAGPDELAMARQFLQMLGTAYAALDPPEVHYHDWVWRADRTIEDLERAPQASRRHYGHLYVMPYPDGQYPDVMVQMSVIAALHDYGRWRGEPVPLEAELKKGLGRFYDPKLKTLRRYLPNVGKEKDAEAVDSWYHYHPMLNLARLAIDGDEEARGLLLKSVDYGIRAARHFQYKWPVMYDAQDFSVKVAARGDERFGQTDVGGLYAYLMLQLYQITADEMYLHEARAAIDAAAGMRFNLEYQANLVAWGAAACMRLWRITNEARYREQSYVYLASFFHNSELWDSQVGHAIHYPTFLGATCLHDSPYMAMYECFDAFTAYEQYLDNAGPDLEPAVRTLVGEFCRHALDRGWYYYPEMLPKEMIADKQESGVICRDLSFPLEDLRGDGKPAGQIGQEIYGCGAAMIFATRSHHRIEDAPFLLYCSLFTRAIERTGNRVLTLQLHGGETCMGEVSIIRLKRHRLGDVTLATAQGGALEPGTRSADRIDFRVPASGELILSWS